MHAEVKLNCTRCGSAMGGCDCWVKCEFMCGWTRPKDGRCGNPEHCKPRAGQEWERRVRHTVRTRAGTRVSFTTLRIRIVAWAYQGAQPLNRGEVETLMPGGKWGRRRSVGLNAFTNTPSGFNLVQEVCAWGHPGCLVKHPMSPEDVSAAPRDRRAT